MSEQKIVIIDGGLSTELKDLGYDLSDSKLWTSKALIKDPDVLKQAHINFLNSGAQIIETASYQLNVSNIIKETGCSIEEAKEYIRKSVKIAIEAREEANLKNACIAGSIGPYGACLADGSEYNGAYVNDLTLDYLMEWHRPRLECLIEAGCDLIAFETIPSIKEATALIDLLAEYPETKAWLSFCCKDETSLANGDDSFKDAYDKFKENKQLVAIGVNCTSPSYVSNLLKSVTKHELPFIVYSNDGSEWDSANFKFVSAYENPIQIVYDMLPEWIRLGARYVGGCCNIGSKYLRAFPNIVQNMNNN